ncbi:MAG: hypothetical protein IBX72_08850 [Nitrospirae bacterium]|jgi:hypothetical protein|nr:hypothetical protein [Nitrospirota bacterium]
MKILKEQGGFIRFALVMALLAFCVYAGIKFGMPYYKYSAFKSDVKEFARISLGDTEKTRAQIFERAAELRLPLEEEDIKVTKKEKLVRVRTAWSETVDILGVYQKKLNFNIDIEE